MYGNQPPPWPQQQQQHQGKPEEDDYSQYTGFEDMGLTQMDPVMFYSVLFLCVSSFCTGISACIRIYCTCN